MLRSSLKKARNWYVFFLHFFTVYADKWKQMYYIINDIVFVINVSCGKVVLSMHIEGRDDVIWWLENMATTSKKSVCGCSMQFWPRYNFNKQWWLVLVCCGIWLFFLRTWVWLPLAIWVAGDIKDSWPKLLWCTRNVPGLMLWLKFPSGITNHKKMSVYHYSS